MKSRKKLIERIQIKMGISIDKKWIVKRQYNLKQKTDEKNMILKININKIKKEFNMSNQFKTNTTATNKITLQ